MSKAVAKLGDWTLSVYPGRKAGSLPASAPEVVLYRGRVDDRKGAEVASDRLTPWDADFGQTLLAALGQQKREIIEQAAWAAHGAIVDRAMRYGAHSAAADYSYDVVVAIKSTISKEAHHEPKPE